MSEKLNIKREHHLLGGALSLPEIRCEKCKTLLMTGEIKVGLIVHKCKCKHMNVIGATVKQPYKDKVA